MTGLLVGDRDGGEAAGDRRRLQPGGEVGDVERHDGRGGREGVEAPGSGPRLEVTPVRGVGAVGA